MRLTATDKAIGELNMRKADIERAAAYLAGTPTGVSAADRIAADIDDIDSCVQLLRTVAAPPKVAKVPKVARAAKPRRSKANGAEVEA